MYMQEQMIKNKRDIPKEEVQSERTVFFLFFCFFLNQKLTIYYASLFLQLVWD